MGRKNYFLGAVIFVLLYVNVPSLVFILQKICNTYAIPEMIAIFIWLPLLSIPGVFCVKRLHDLNLSGYFALCIFSELISSLIFELLVLTLGEEGIPQSISYLLYYLGMYVAPLFVLVLLLKRSKYQDAPNRFGTPDTNRSLRESLFHTEIDRSSTPRDTVLKNALIASVIITPVITFGSVFLTLLSLGSRDEPKLAEFLIYPLSFIPEPQSFSAILFLNYIFYTPLVYLILLLTKSFMRWVDGY